jgi:hypothetical protein
MIGQQKGAADRQVHGSLPEVSFGSGESQKRLGSCRRDGKIDWRPVLATDNSGRSGSVRVCG